MSSLLNLFTQSLGRPTYELPLLQIFARVDRNPGKGIKARRSTKEGFVPLWDEYAAGIWVKAW